MAAASQLQKHRANAGSPRTLHLKQKQNVTATTHPSSVSKLRVTAVKSNSPVPRTQGDYNAREREQLQTVDSSMVPALEIKGQKVADEVPAGVNHGDKVASIVHSLRVTPRDE